jgi:hypothetical protein
MDRLRDDLEVAFLIDNLNYCRVALLCLGGLPPRLVHLVSTPYYSSATKTAKNIEAKILMLLSQFDFSQSDIVDELPYKQRQSNSTRR